MLSVPGSTTQFAVVAVVVRRLAQEVLEKLGGTLLLDRLVSPPTVSCPIIEPWVEQV